MSLRFSILALLLAVLAGPSNAEAPLPTAAPDGSGGGEYRVRDLAPHLTDAQRVEIRAQIESNAAELRAQGKLPRAIAAPPSMMWPLAAPALTDAGYHGISNFVDHDPGAGSVLDWNCGGRSYDLASGYNHSGVDIFTWPFPWLRMQSSQVWVVAGAGGTIVLKSDGNYDQSCGFGGGNWNAVYVRHDDGSVAWYGHLKTGSLTFKTVGQSVSQGEYLGVVGSSGNSTSPHLHLEVYDSSGVLNDPFQGPCNALNADTWWAIPPSYYDPKVNHLATGFAAPDATPPCPTVESPNERNAFFFGEPIYFSSYYRDQVSSLTSQNRIYRPDGSLYSAFSDPSPPNHYAASYWYWYFSSFAPSGPAGTWRYEISFNGQTHSHEFTLASATAAGRVPESGGAPEPPLQLARAAGGQVQLTWGASCDSGDDEYGVYEGILGLFYTHVSIKCHLAAKTWTVGPGTGSSYYLVVPANGAREGSYGRRSGAIERPTGSSQCRVRELGGCP